jgi:chemotaxis protein methyltransferase CheR
VTVAAPLTFCSTAPALARFRLLIGQHLGLQYDDDKLGGLAELMAQRLKATSAPDEGHYLDALESVRGEEEWQALAPALTVAETYFFRHVEQFHALRHRILPDRSKHAGALRPLRVLSAGCASGEEAYSIAMTVASAPEWADWDVRIDAIDLNPVVLAKARAGRYRDWSLRETPDAMRLKWFTKDGQEYLLDERIRAMVRFTRCNLADGDDPFWQADRYDVVFCRNVLMYFGTPRMQQVLARFAHALMTDGYLMMGHAESLRGLNSDFRLRHSHGTFYYQLADPAAPSVAQVFQDDHDEADPNAPEQPLPPDAGAWVQAIGRSADRVRALAAPLARTAPSPETPCASGPQARPHDALRALVDAEQFQEALALFERKAEGEATPPAEAEPWWEVMHVSLLMHVGRIDEAEALCRRQLAAHPFQADLHHALALCLAADGRLSDAMDSDRAAAFIDPSFAMPQLHLGSLARRLGDAPACKRAFAMGQRLVGHESAERLRLFAGGFSREDLRALCRGEVDASGEGR